MTSFGPFIRSEMLETIAESVPLLVMDLDSGELLFASSPLERMFGYFIRGELQGVQIEMLLPERFREQHKAHRIEYAKNPTSRSMGFGGTFTALGKDGLEFKVQIGLSAAVISRHRCAIATVLRMH